LQLLDAVRHDPPDWLVLQFNQFSYGRWGLNPYLPLVLRRIKRECPSLRIAWLAHEDVVPCTSLRFAVMSSWQWAQFWALGQLADQIFFTTDVWVSTYRSWFPNTPMQCLPVGSNIPRVDANRSSVRARLGIEPDTFIVGYFGSLHNSRLLPTLRSALGRLRSTNDQVEVLYVGSKGDALRHELPGVPIHDAGALPADAVSRCFAAMDLHLTPFLDGVSTRRGSFMTGLQHGLPTVATEGAHTAPWMADAHDEAFLLAPEDDPDAFAEHAHDLMMNPARRRALGAGGRAFYDRHFDWPVLASTLRGALADHGTADGPPTAPPPSPMTDAAPASSVPSRPPSSLSRP
jgi:glycosyltransferase involved in cell wall biosynthesis